ncbi:MAG: acyloxyacyl hydrolase [Pseudomonadota bacterium]
MHRIFGFILAATLTPVHALELGIDYAEPFFGDEKALSLAAVRVSTGLPWQMDMGGGWIAFARFDTSFGRIDGRGASSSIVMAGPGLKFVSPNHRWSASLFFRPALMERASLEDIDFGGQIQFETSIGGGYRVSKHLSLRFDFIHISNGGLDNPNPGWNSQRIGISYSF